MYNSAAMLQDKLELRPAGNSNLYFYKCLSREEILLRLVKLYMIFILIYITSFPDIILVCLRCSGFDI